MQPHQGVDEDRLFDPLGILEPPEQHARLHRQIGAGGELDVENPVDPTRTLERPQALGDRPRRLGDDGALVGRRGALAAEADPIGLRMIPSELDRGEDPAGTGDRSLSGGPQAGVGPELELAKKRVLVRVVEIEGADPEAGGPGNGVGVDPLAAVASEQPEAYDEQSLPGVLESGSRHRSKLTD